MINDRDSKEINQALPVRHPGTIDPGAVIAVVAALEGLGAVVTHLLHWPEWIGAQGAVIYLMWQWSKERQFAHQLASAWNRKRDAEVEVRAQLRGALRHDDEN